MKAGVSAEAIASEYASRPDNSPYDVAGARKAGLSDDQIVKEIAAKTPSTLLGGIIGAPSAKVVHDAALAVIPGSVQRGTAQAVEGLANTADVLGAPGVGGYLHNQVNQDQLKAPMTTDALTTAFKDGHYGSVLTDLPGAIGEAVPQLGATLAGAVGGAAAGAAVGGPVGGVGGFALGAGGDALMNVAIQAGNIAKARAKADGRSEPDASDIAVAVGSSGVMGALGRIGLGEAGGSLLTTFVKRALGRDAAGTAGKAVGSATLHGASDAAQSVIQQAAETTGTAQGTTIDPNAVASQAIIGAGTRGALGAARGLQDRVTGQAAIDARDTQTAADRSTWSTMTPEDQQRIGTTAAAGQAVTNVQNSAVGDVSPAVAARTAIAQRSQAVLDYAKHQASDDVGTLDRDQVATIKQAVTAASRPSQTLTADHIASIDALPIPEDQRHALIGALGEMNALSDPANQAPVGGPVSQGLGLAGDLMGHAMHVHGAPGFILRPVINAITAKTGATIDRLIGADKPKLLGDANRAAAMLEANGLQVPDNIGSLKGAIANSQSAIQAMAGAVGLDPANYGLDATLRTAVSRQAGQASKDVITPAPTTMTPAEALALAKTGVASGTPQVSLQTPNAVAGSGQPGGVTMASTDNVKSPGHLSDPEPAMLSTPPQSPESLMAQRLPRWQWVLGNKVQQDLALAGMSKNLNYSKEAATTIGQLRDTGLIDGPLHDKLMTYDGQTVPRGFFNLVRNQMLLNHGVDRRTMAAQSAAPPGTMLH